MEKALTALSSQAIEGELTALWKTDSKEKGFQRIYTTNIVAYAPDHAEGFRVERILNDLALNNPNRTILIRPAADVSEAPLRYYVSGHRLYWRENGKRICCDTVKLVAQKEIIENLYGFTFSLLVPDLPVEFWWPSDMPQENPFFEAMAKQANRVWVDSSKFKNPIPSLARFAASWESRYPHTQLGDLNWVRIQRWRALIAEMFDGEWSKFLKDIRQVTIEYAESNQPTRSFFLACWLATQLGWKYQGPRLSEFPQEIDFEGPNGRVQVLLKPVPVSDQRDRIFAVGLIVGGEKPSIFTVIRDQDPHCVVARSEIDHKTAFNRVVSFEHLHSNELLAEGLRHLEGDWVWKKTLATAGTILEKPGDFSGA